MSPNSDTLRALFAPLPNYENIPTINVCSHEVPLPAYWRITELLNEGIEIEQIVRLIVAESGIKTHRSVEEIVNAISDNQRHLKNASKNSAAAVSANKNSKASNRLSALLVKRPKKRISSYRASRLDEHRELEDAESKLENFKMQEKQQLSTALALARRKEMLNDTSTAAGRKISEEERRRTIAIIDHEIKQTLHRHAEIETQIEYARRLTVMQKATFA
jgi:hypothetical protein